LAFRLQVVFGIEDASVQSDGVDGGSDRFFRGVLHVGGYVARAEFRCFVSRVLGLQRGPRVPFRHRARSAVLYGEYAPEVLQKEAGVFGGDVAVVDDENALVDDAVNNPDG
jgi:hypothetical protein